MRSYSLFCTFCQGRWAMCLWSQSPYCGPQTFPRLIFWATLISWLDRISRRVGILLLSLCWPGRKVWCDKFKLFPTVLTQRSRWLWERTLIQPACSLFSTTGKRPLNNEIHSVNKAFFVVSFCLSDIQSWCMYVWYSDIASKCLLFVFWI